MMNSYLAGLVQQGKARSLQRFCPADEVEPIDLRELWYFLAGPYSDR